MIAIAIESSFITPKTFVFGIIIGQTKLPRPVASAFYPEVIVTVFCQFAVAAGAFQNALTQSDTGRNTMGTHFLHSNKLERIDVLPRAHQLCLQWQQKTRK